MFQIEEFDFDEDKNKLWEVKITEVYMQLLSLAQA